METFQLRGSLERLEDRSTPATMSQMSFAAAQAQATAAMISSIQRDMDWVFNPAMRPTVQQFVRTMFHQSNAAMAVLPQSTSLYATALSNRAFAQNLASGLAFPMIPPKPPVPPKPDAGMTNKIPPANSPAWITQANGIKIWDVKTGTGTPIAATGSLTAFYTGWLTNGTVFDSKRSPASPASFSLSGVIQGWQLGIPGMQNGGIRRLYIPAALAYGSAGQGNVPPNSDLIFEVKMMTHT